MLPIKESELTNTFNDEDIIKTDFEKERYTNPSTVKLNDFFHVNPIDFKGKTFENDNEVFIKDINIDLNYVIESYDKAISKL